MKPNSCFPSSRLLPLLASFFSVSSSTLVVCPVTLADISALTTGMIQVLLYVQEALTPYNADTDTPQHAGFKGLCSVFVTAAFSFSGTELVGLAAAETANPRIALPTAVKQVFWRIALVCPYVFLCSMTS